MVDQVVVAVIEHLSLKARRRPCREAPPARAGRASRGQPRTATQPDNGFSGYHCVIDDQLAESDQVVTRAFRGTQSGQLMGIPPTGKQVTVTGVAIDRIADGKLVESWLEMDAQRMLQDLGVAG